MTAARILAVACMSLSATCAFAADAPQPDRPSAAAIQRMVRTTTPELRVEKPDHERLTARRIDIVDANGVIRMVLAAPTPDPIIDGVQYRRAFSVAGLTVFDAAGSERGGLGVADVEGGMAVLALDHPTTDAIGWRVLPDGAVKFMMNDRPEHIREPAIGDRLIPGVKNATRISLDIAADGQPSINLADSENRPRLRLTVTPEGFGAIQFLDSQGEVVETFAPEAVKRSK